MTEPEPALERAYAAYRAHARPSADERAALWASLSHRIAQDDAAGAREQQPASPVRWPSWRLFVAAAILLLVGAAAALVDEVRTLDGRTGDRSPYSAGFESPGGGDGPQPSTAREPAARPLAWTRARPDAAIDPPLPLPPAPEHIAPVESPSPAPLVPRVRMRAPELPPAPPPAKVPSVTEEASLLQAARTALARREPERALARIRDHARRFTHGALAPERQVLEIRAWCQLGEDEEARRVAAAFVVAFPRPPWAARVHRPCEDER